MASPRCTVLVVDDEAAIRSLLHELLADTFDVVAAASAEEAKAVLSSRAIDIILSDQQLPGLSGVHLLEHVCLHYPTTIRILMTGTARLEDAVDAINCGRVHRYLFKPWNSDQLVQTLHHAARAHLLERSHEQLLQDLRRLNAELEARVQQRTRELEEANFQLQQKNGMLTRMALTDALTDLPNRRAVDRLARGELLRRARYGNSVALGLVDADHFKAINSRHLLSGGDHVLAWLARKLAQAVRAVDTVGRVGGEEFMIVAPETDVAGAETLAERIRDSVAAEPATYSGQAIRVTVSVGMAVLPDGVQANYDQLRHFAAGLLQEAKDAGRNRSVVRAFSPPGPQPGA